MSFDAVATTNPGLERVAAAEVVDLLGSDATADVDHRGAIRFACAPGDFARLNRRSRTLHRVLCVLRETRFEDLDDVARAVRRLPLERYLAERQSFAVRASRHGDHPFGSPDVAEVVGQAVIDGYRDATGHRLAVDLDDPDVALHATVRHDRFRLAVDTTGTSLHDRGWRVCEHDAPIRPTVAASLVRLAGLSPGESLLDPTCGSGTIPVEAALYARGIPHSPDRGYALSRLGFLPSGATDGDRRDGRRGSGDGVAVIGRDADPSWIECARENARSAGVDTRFDVADATTTPPEADRVVCNPPYGVRLDDPEPLYRDLFRSFDRGSWSRLVLITGREGLVPWEPDERFGVPLGRLDAAVLVFDR
ncbi:class I SAM-dependent RNA methyltransferase [Salinirubellus sp. GCM10025818]|uniref:THUMP domain-containing class I SAM-dependent RNA methyltransferase n=1 Tax=Salinirubellus TaxID=2162630 RepID=UPI0030D18C2E